MLKLLQQGINLGDFSSFKPRPIRVPCNSPHLGRIVFRIDDAEI